MKKNTAKIGIMRLIKLLIALELMFMAPLTMAQEFNGYSWIINNNKGLKLYYDVYNIKVEKNPTYLIKTKILTLATDNTRTESEYEINCNSGGLKVDGVEVLNSNPPNVGHRIRQFLCGSEQKHSTWLYAFLLPVNNDGAARYYFLNSENLQKVLISIDGNKVEGIRMTYGQGTFDNQGLFNINVLDETIFNCTEEVIYEKVNNKYTANKIESIFGSGLMGTRHNICKGIYSNLVKQNVLSLLDDAKPIKANIPEISRIDSAKSKCTELGFKSGTEGFGKCVLQLSK